MAKEKKEERIFHCSGPKWAGDGSSATSACPFGDSMMTRNRYKCSHCVTGQTPGNIFTDAKGIKAKSSPAKDSSKPTEVKRKEKALDAVVSERTPEADAEQLPELSVEAVKISSESDTKTKLKRKLKKRSRRF